MFLLLAVPARAQITTGTILGQVRDQANAPLEDAIITVINALNRNKRATRSNETGDYVMPNLPPGAYHLIVHKDGYVSQCVESFHVLFNKNNPVKYPPRFMLVKKTGGGGNPVCDALMKNQTSAIRAGQRPLLAIALPRWEDVMAPVADQAVGVAPTVQGSDARSLVNTADVMRSSNFTEEQLAALPLGAGSYQRSFDELVLLAPGVAPPPYTPGVRGPGVGFGIGTAGQFSVNGMRARSNNFSIDGTDNNDSDVGVRRGGYVIQALQSVGSVKEVSIATLLWSAESGRNFGSQVNAVSKYGGADYHGQVEGFFADSRMKAREYFESLGQPSASKNPFTRTQVGAGLSGPLFSKHAQFFLGFEQNKTNATVTENYSVPVDGGAQRELRLRFPCDRLLICEEGNYASSASLGVYPKANAPGGVYGANTLTRKLPADGGGTFSVLKLTREFGNSHTLNAKYGFAQDGRVLPSINQAINSTINAQARGQNLSLILDSQISLRFFNQARVSFGRTRVAFPEHPLGPFNVARFGGSSNSISHGATFYCQYYAVNGIFPAYACAYPLFIYPYLQIVGEITVAPYSSVGVNARLFPQGRVNNNYQFADAAAWQSGGHRVRFGGDFRRVQLNNFQNRLYRAEIRYGYGVKDSGNLDLVFDPTQTNYRFTSTSRTIGSSLDLRMLFPSSTLQTLTVDGADSRLGLRLWESLLFLQDQWQLRPRVTLSMGLRYEYSTVPTDAGHRIENALSLRNLPAPTTAKTPAERDAYESVLNAYREVLGNRKTMYDPDRNNFAPQVGVAWSIGKDGRTSLRAGYGVYYDAVLGAVISQSRSLFPDQIPVGIDGPYPGDLSFPASCATVICEKVGDFTFIKTNQLKGGIADFASSIARLKTDLRAGLAFSLPAKTLPAPFAQQWHATLEREFVAGILLSMGYVGTTGSKLTRIVTPNLGAENTPRVQFSKVTYYEGLDRPVTVPALLLDTAKLLLPARPIPEIGSYQIFENAARSTYHGLQIEATRRFAEQVNFTAAYTWSHAIDEVSDIFPISGAPVIAQNQQQQGAERGNANFDLRHRLAASVIWDLPKGLQFTALGQAQSGQPFTINVPIDANLDGNLSDRLSTPQGLVMVDGNQRERIRLASGVTLDNFVVLGKDGVVGRNTFRGANFLNVDASLAKTIRFARDRSLLLRAEVFNLFNRPNFGLPVRTLDAPGFGSAIATINPARTVQVALRFQF